jgi:hypothetical protein
MKRINRNAAAIAVMIFTATIITSEIFAQRKEAPSNVTAALIIKLAAFEKNLSGSEGDITIYIMGDPSVAKEFKKGIGRKIGKATIKRVIEGSSLPSTKPSILYIGDGSKVKETIKYTRSNNILSTTGLPELVEKGVTLGIGIGENGKPEIFLSISSSVEENLNWNPAIMKIAKIIK